MMASSIEKKIILKSLDGKEFEVEEAMARKSMMIGNMIINRCTEDMIPPLNVDGRTLAKVIEYCRHVGATSTPSEYQNADNEIKSWDAAYINVDQAILHDLILAANYLDIKDLLDLASKKVASMIRGKNVEEIRKTFHIKNDFTPEEEEEEDIRKRHPWAVE